MTRYANSITSSILAWARNRSGYTLEEVARKMGKDVSVIASWEAGESYPTYLQLEKLAYQIYKRPVALFFFPEPPDECDPAGEFRTLPEFEIENLSADTRLALRQAKAMQIALAELNGGVNPSVSKLLRGLRIGPKGDPGTIAGEVRDYLGITLEIQRSWKNTEEALKRWRSAIQDNGIFVFKRSFRQKDISGFCLGDDEFPVIYLNNSTSYSRQIFTLFHELGHLLLRSNGITKKDDRFIDTLAGRAEWIEKNANRFAAEFLVPAGELEALLGDAGSIMDAVPEYAARYKVSREVILRKCLDKGLINRDTYLNKADE